MKHVTTGLGLSVLGMGIAVWPVLDRLEPMANAGASFRVADSGRFETPNPGLRGAFADVSAISASGTNVPITDGRRAGSCSAGTDEWFAPTFHPISGCSGNGRMSANFDSAPDIDHDGSPEFVRGLQVTLYEFGTSIETSACLMALTQAIEVDGWTAEQQVCVAPCPAGLWSAVSASFPGLVSAAGATGRVTAYGNGWRDMDADGDEDLMLLLEAEGGAWAFASGWLENIGFESGGTPPRSADLNDDGSVDGSDLGLLLAAWSAGP